MPPAKLSSPQLSSELLSLEGISLSHDVTKGRRDGRDDRRSPVRSSISRTERPGRRVLSPAVVPIPLMESSLFKSTRSQSELNPSILDCISIRKMSMDDKASQVTSVSASRTSPHTTLTAPTPTARTPIVSGSRITPGSKTPLSMASIKLPPLGSQRDTTERPSTPCLPTRSPNEIRSRPGSFLGSLRPSGFFMLEGRSVTAGSPQSGKISPQKVLPVTSLYCSENEEQDAGESRLEVNGSSMPVNIKSDGSDIVDAEEEQNMTSTQRPQSYTFRLGGEKLTELSEATKKLLYPKDEVSKLTNLPTVSLPKLRGTKGAPTAKMTPRFPPLGQAASSSMFWGKDDSRNAEERDNRRYDMVNTSLCLGPEQPPAVLEADTIPAQSGSFNLRKEYGKNLEKSWYQQMLENARVQREEKKFKTLCALHKLDKTLDEFYMSFYSSGTESDDDVVINIGDKEHKKTALSDGDVDIHSTEVSSPLIRFASTDVLVSGQSEDSQSDIEVILKGNDVVDKRVKHKMRRRRHRHETRYERLFGPELEAERRRMDFEDGTFCMPDTEIRAMRLRLKKAEEEDGYTENCTIAELKEQVMKVLNNLNGSRKGRSRKKKRRTKDDSSKGYGMHIRESMYERFLTEYGHLLDGYVPEPLSDDSDSETDAPERGQFYNDHGVGSYNNCIPGKDGYQPEAERSLLGSSMKMNVRLPSLRFSYSPLISTDFSNGQTPTAESDILGYTDMLPPRRRKKTRLQKVLVRFQEDRSNLLQRAGNVKYVQTPRSSRRNSDPGVHNGKVLVQQKILETEEDIAEAQKEVKAKKKSKRKGKRNAKAALKRETSSIAVDGQVSSNHDMRDEDRPSSSQGQLGETDMEFRDKPVRRTQSFRFFRTNKDKEITLRELTKGHDFPAKEVKLEIAERRLQRQRMRKGRVNANAIKEKIDDKNREERRKLIALAKAEYLKHLEKARAECGTVREGYDTEHSSTEDEDGGKKKQQKAKSKARRRSNGQLCELNPKPDYKSIINNSPIVPTGVSWSKADSYRRTELSQKDIEEEAANVTDLLIEMKDCRYIRWSNIQQRIIDHVNELELEQYDYDESD